MTPETAGTEGSVPPLPEPQTRHHGNQEMATTIHHRIAPILVVTGGLELLLKGELVFHFTSHRIVCVEY
jgi:hypothetical protein